MKFLKFLFYSSVVVVVFAFLVCVGYVAGEASRDYTQVYQRGNPVSPSFTRDNVEVVFIEVRDNEQLKEVRKNVSERTGLPYSEPDGSFAYYTEDKCLVVSVKPRSNMDVERFGDLGHSTYACFRGDF